MIITKLLGGLGNQMFQYAAGLALAEQHRTVLKLDVSWFRLDPAYEAHNRYALSCLNITEQFATQEEIDRCAGRSLTRAERWSRTLGRTMRFYGYADSLTPRGRRYSMYGATYASALFDQPDYTYMEGMWQSEKYFAPVSDLLRLHFSMRYPQPQAVADMGSIIATGPSAVLHFRRGDYVRDERFKNGIGVLPFEYYHQAIEIITAKCPEVTFFVFSDDIHRIRDSFNSRHKCVFVDAVKHWHAYDKIRLMSLCRYFVISNSTFAWWAAWLSQSPEKLVIAPDPWFADPECAKADIVPEAWLKLPSRHL